MESGVRKGKGPTGRVILNLGAGNRPIEGAVNVDKVPGPGIDLVADLNEEWPWGESSIDGIVSEDCFEHLYPLGKAEAQANVIEVMRRCWHVLKPGGYLRVQVPTTESRAAFQDPTHVTYWNLNTFRYFVKGFPHWKVYDGFGIEFGFGPGGYVKAIPPDDTGAAWVEAYLEAVKE